MREVDTDSAAGFAIFADDATSPGTGLAGLTITAALIKNGGTQNAVAPSISDKGDGVYWVTPIAAHRDTDGVSVWKFSASGAIISPVFEWVRPARAQQTTAAAAQTAAEAADGKLTAGRMSRVDRLPDVAAGDAGGLSLVGSAMTLDSATVTALFADVDVAGLVASISGLFDEATDVPADTIATLAATRTVTALAALISDAAAAKAAAESADGLLSAMTEVVEAITRFKASALSQAAAASGGLTTEQVEQLDRIESQTSKLSGAPVKVDGNVKPGGRMIIKHGDDHLVSQGNALSVGVSDIGGSLFALMNAVGVENLAVYAIIGKDADSRIEGTVAALSYASDVLTVTFEFAASETTKGRVGPVYSYDCIRTGTPTRTYFSGTLTVDPDAR